MVTIKNKYVFYPNINLYASFTYHTNQHNYENIYYTWRGTEFKEVKIECNIKTDVQCRKIGIQYTSSRYKTKPYPHENL